MNLPIPIVGVDAGPAYATLVDNCLTIIDGHNHSPGSGVQITPDGLNINSTLTIQGQFLTNIGGLTFSSQSVTPANQTVYFSGVNLFVTDGNGNIIPITASGGLAGTPGSISNLTAPASASYVSANSTFVFQSDTATAANIDAGSIILRDLTASSHGLTLSPPLALSSDYTITLPTLPSQLSVLTLSTSGAMATVSFDQVGVNMTSVGANAIQATTTRPLNSSTAGGVAVSGSSGATSGTSSTSFVALVNQSVTVFVSSRPVSVSLQADGSGNLSFMGLASATSGATFTIGLLRDSATLVSQWETSISAVGTSNVGLIYGPSITFLDTTSFTPNTTHTYQWLVKVSSGGSPLFESAFLQTVAYEI